ncbi:MULTISPECIES: LysM domain-containing protein [Thermoactinomyces]|jgi:morphogenetic protein associated with SpoVID|uniref:LysM peptidoglycan-binding domain-containing protein n=1 Tax=Thermoactinomyces daqus TaxID=1329516 RepID=A0A7W1X7B4_9BACL|nr:MULTISPECIES: LysM domain-containing protein [Thermoactinomyces]MBA4541369.1 LysM peptidoglycan-binding domain-containing protein [Thermoactinomyces daqus]MBH8596842.1 LysM peptidoglycan-binding domain-containing protein [Thermoactinomyces sp. CICC 10523]MBH8603602.1 LysM peptidoglycan-binding domain-containing protein [Thermoactinomyces sp. CICC 10522]MBH8606767.1 LysM peptidoglycan-binding domain-containing protein [Thermoactinomyces sp. CICC 10521]
MKIHIVRPGDTLWVLAQKYNTPIERLREVNPELTEGNELEPGMKIRVPTGKFLLSSSKNKEMETKIGDVPAEEEKRKTIKAEKDRKQQMDFLPKPPHIPEMPFYYQGFSSSFDSPESSFFDEGGYRKTPVPPVSPYPYHISHFWPQPVYGPTPFVSAFPYPYGSGYGYHVPYFPSVSNYSPEAYQPDPYGGQEQATPAFSSPVSANWPVKESSSSEG